MNIKRLMLAKILTDLQAAEPEMRPQIEQASEYVEELETHIHSLERQLRLANAHIAAIKAFDEESKQ